MNVKKFISLQKTSKRENYKNSETGTEVDVYIRYWVRPAPTEELFQFLEKVTRNVKVKGTKRPVYKHTFIQISSFTTRFGSVLNDFVWIMEWLKNK